ncbi:MAG TPA: hypothetical protein VGB75_09615 [Jatrophihabitans sp.]|uniref:hypothetical protein n=1 Tax=Jatrophihabitans sp. TaxID=1932789 RepID=UPI002EE1A393
MLSAGCSSADSPNPSNAAGEVAPAAAGEPLALGGLAQQGGSRPIPGTDAAIQRWFLANDAVKVRFNDALLRAQRAVATGDAAECRPLDTAARALSTALPALRGLSPAGQELATAMQPPMTTFTTAASACLAQDFAAARAALDVGVVQQAAAQESVDEILEGE